MSPREKRREQAGNLTISQRRALVLAKRHNGLVRIERVYRASYAPGAEKIKVETVHALIARAMLMRFGEHGVVLTEAGKVEAERSEAMARNAVERVDADRRFRAERAKPRHPHPGQFKARLPYVDN
jgi:hypothetical protein